MPRYFLSDRQELIKLHSFGLQETGWRLRCHEKTVRLNVKCTENKGSVRGIPTCGQFRVSSYMEDRAKMIAIGPGTKLIQLLKVEESIYLLKFVLCLMLRIEGRKWRKIRNS